MLAEKGGVLEMKYPCDECLVDVVCSEICDNLIFFSDHLTSYIPRFLVQTEARFNRLRLCILKYGGESERVVKLDNNIVAQRYEVIKGKKK